MSSANPMRARCLVTLLYDIAYAHCALAQDFGGEAKDSLRDLISNAECLMPDDEFRGTVIETAESAVAILRADVSERGKRQAATDLWRLYEQLQRSLRELL